MRLLALIVLTVVSHAVTAQTLADRGRAAYQNGDFATSAGLYAEALASGGRDGSDAYNAACSFALSGQPDAAFRHLGLAARLGFSDARLAQRDTDLASLHGDGRWLAAVAAIEAQAAQQARLWDSPALSSDYRADLTDDEKVAGLSKLWAEARFSFANFDLVPRLDWDSLYVASLPLVRETTSTRDYYRVLTAVVAQLHDGHTNVFYPDALDAEVYARPGLRTRLVDGRVLVVSLSDSLRGTGLAIGDEVTAVDGTPVQAYAEASVRPYQSASTPQDLDVRTYEYALLSGSAAAPVRLTLRDARGQTPTRTVPRLVPERRREALPAPEPFTLEWRPGRIAHVRLTSFGTDEAATRFLAAFPEIQTAAGLILDVRENGGGNSGVGAAILATLIDAPGAVSTWQTRDYRPAHRAWGQTEATTGGVNTVDPDPEHHYAGPVAVLTSARTFSAAEDFAVAFDAVHRGVIIGEPTGGSTGQPLSFALPGGGSARICAKRDRYPDGTEFVGVGVQPDVVVGPTVDDVRAERDPVLDAAVRTLRGEALRGE